MLFDAPGIGATICHAPHPPPRAPRARLERVWGGGGGGHARQRELAGRGGGRGGRPTTLSGGGRAGAGGEKVGLQKKGRNKVNQPPPPGVVMGAVGPPQQILEEGGGKTPFGGHPPGAGVCTSPKGGRGKGGGKGSRDRSLGIDGFLIDDQHGVAAIHQSSSVDDRTRSARGQLFRSDKGRATSVTPDSGPKIVSQ